MTCTGISSCMAPAASFSKGLFWTGCQGGRVQSSVSPMCGSISVLLTCAFPKSLSQAQSPSQGRKQLKHLLSLGKPGNGLVSSANPMLGEVDREIKELVAPAHNQPAA